MRIGSGLVPEIRLHVAQRFPGDKVSRETALTVTGEDALDLWEIAFGMKRRDKMTKAAGTTEFKPLCQGGTIEMQGEEILEIVKREQKVGDAGCLCGIVVGAMVIVAMVEVEVRPDLNGRDFPIVSAGSVVGTLDFPEGASLGNGMHRADKAQGRFKGVGRQWLRVQKTLQAL